MAAEPRLLTLFVSGPGLGVLGAKSLRILAQSCRVRRFDAKRFTSEDRQWSRTVAPCHSESF